MLIIANFKENLSEKEFHEYFDVFVREFPKLGTNSETKIIFCPSFPYLSLVSKKVSIFQNIYVGSQDVSSFKAGSYTGEVSAKQLKDYCKYSIVGHSERRKNLKDGIEDINKKIYNLIEESIEPILCISKKEEFEKLKPKDILLAYEPIGYIGGTNTVSSENIEQFYKTLQISSGIIYGGSVNYQSVKNIMELPFLKGFLVATGCLNPNEFLKLIQVVQNKS